MITTILSLILTLAPLPADWGALPPQPPNPPRARMARTAFVGEPAQQKPGPALNGYTFSFLATCESSMFVFERSTDMVTWTEVASGPNTPLGISVMMDCDATGQSGFYRVRGL